MDERMIPYFSHEGDMARMERANKRLWIVVLVLIAVLLGTNGAWIWHESQYVDEIEIKQDADWDDNSNVIVNGTGEVNVNGQSEANDN